jgi:hypothetical protein
MMMRYENSNECQFMLVTKGYYDIGIAWVDHHTVFFVMHTPYIVVIKGGQWSKLNIVRELARVAIYTHTVILS